MPSLQKAVLNLRIYLLTLTLMGIMTLYQQFRHTERKMPSTSHNMRIFSNDNSRKRTK